MPGAWPEQLQDYDVTLFDPPQKKAQWAAKMRNINMFTPRCRAPMDTTGDRRRSTQWTQITSRSKHLIAG
jgi:hypothetical protein